MPKKKAVKKSSDDSNKQHVLHAASLVTMAQAYDREESEFARNGSEAAQGARLAMQANARVFRAEAVRIRGILR